MQNVDKRAVAVGDGEFLVTTSLRLDRFRFVQRSCSSLRLFVRIGCHKPENLQAHKKTERKDVNDHRRTFHDESNKYIYLLTVRRICSKNPGPCSRFLISSEFASQIKQGPSLHAAAARPPIVPKSVSLALDQYKDTHIHTHRINPRINNNNYFLITANTVMRAINNTDNKYDRTYQQTSGRSCGESEWAICGRT